MIEWELGYYKSEIAGFNPFLHLILLSEKYTFGGREPIQQRCESVDSSSPDLQEADGADSSSVPLCKLT